MANAVGSVERLQPDDLFEIAQLSLSAPNLQAIAVSSHSDSRGVVPAVFKAAKPLNDDRDHAFRADVSNYAAHKFLILSSA
jgi:hypothetical protein